MEIPGARVQGSGGHAGIQSQGIEAGRGSFPDRGPRNRLKTL